MSSANNELTETTENYLKIIYNLIIKHKYARISDIAKEMSRSLSTVTGAVQRMANEGLLNYEKYGKITLTDKGEKLARSVYQSFTIMADLLISLGIDKEIAEVDACSMEHQVSNETLDKINNFNEFLQTDMGKKMMMEYLKWRDSKNKSLSE